MEEELDSLPQDGTPEGRRLCEMAKMQDEEGLLHAIRYEGVPVDARGLRHQTALMICASSGQLQMVHQLLTLGADVHADDWYGYTALYHGAQTHINPAEVLAALLDAGADIHACDAKHFESPLTFAQRFGFNVALDTIKRYLDMPALGEAERWTKAWLTEPQMVVGCEPETRMNTPETWHRWDEVARALEARGERFTKAELLEPHGVDGKSYLERAIECRSFGKVTEVLQRQGENWMPEDIHPNGEYAPWVKKLVQTKQLHALFDPQIWEDKSTALLRQTLHALPPEYRAEIPHAQQLVLLKAAESAQRGGRS